MCCGCSSVGGVDLSCLFCCLLCVLFLLSPCYLSLLFSPELLDSRGKSGISRSMMAPHTQLAHSWSYCVDRVVNYLLLGRLMKSYVFFSLAAAHLTLPSHLPPIPPSVSSVFCVSPSSWNSSTRLARKIGHPLVLLSPLQHSKKIIL